MPSHPAHRITRIGVFYDGNFFHHCTTHYAHHHERRARISVGGLHEFIVARVAHAEGVETRHCHIVDAHYFRGRHSAVEAERRGLLLGERTFDDTLMRHSVTPHYLPLGPQGEKGVDVWLALEALELTIHKQFDVVVLIAGDGDFVPLVRKLSTLGTRVMLLGWDLEHIDGEGRPRVTKTSLSLLDEVTYPVLMSGVIDDRTMKNDPLINGLFRGFEGRPREPASAPIPADPSAPAEPRTLGRIARLLESYGFIQANDGGESLFFHATSLRQGLAFRDLSINDSVSFIPRRQERGMCATDVRTEQELVEAL